MVVDATIGVPRSAIYRRWTRQRVGSEPIKSDGTGEATIIDAWKRLRLPIRQGITFPILGFAFIGFFLLIGVSDDAWSLLWVPVLMCAVGVVNGLSTERRDKKRAAESSLQDPQPGDS